MARVTSADVARESGVSRTTVSYVLNGTPGQMISERTAQRVREVAERLGYAPSAAARTLRSGRSDLVLFVLPDWPLGPSIDAILDPLAGALAERGLSLLVYQHRGRPLSQLWKAVTPRAVVGMRSSFTEADERAMRQAGIPVVSTLLDEDPWRPTALTVSQTRIGRLQVEHLASTGHRRIGYAALDDPRVAEFIRRRLDGARLACADLGLAEPLVARIHLDVSEAESALRAWRAAGLGVTAVAAYNDETAMAVLAGLHRLGLEAPGDLAVIGVDDIPTAALATPPLTTISQSATAQAHYLAAHVLSELDGTDPPPLPSGEVLELVLRESA